MKEEINPTESFDKAYSLIEDSDFIDDNNNPVVNDIVGTRGEHIKASERHVAAARHIRAGTVNKYYIKVNNTGALYDPTDITARSEAQRKRSGMPIYYMQQVKQGQFNSYLAFLKTKNKQHLIQARQIY